jgi:Hsp70 protein
VARLRFECVDAKEALSTDTEVTIPVLLPNIQTEVRLTRSELEQMVRPALEGSITALDRALRSANVKTADVSTVLLVGGSSRVPLVAELVGSELGRPVAIDAHPKYSVALGAAVIAAGQDVADAANRSKVAAVPEEPSPGTGIAGAAAAGFAAGGVAGAAMAHGAPPRPAQPVPPGATAPGAPPGPGAPFATPVGGPGAGPTRPPTYGGPGGYQGTPASTYSQVPSGGYPASGPQSGGYPAGGPSSGGYAQPPSGSRTGLWIALGGIAAVVLAVVGFVAFSGGDDGGTTGSTTTSTTSGTGSTTGPTTGGGTGVPDADLLEMQTSCQNGAMRDCDALWLLSPTESDYESFAETCGGLDTAGGHQGTCYTDYPDQTGITITLSAAALDGLAGGCTAGYMNYCDMLYHRTPFGSPQEDVAQNCGGHATDGQDYNGTCQETYGANVSTTDTTG